LHRALKEEGIQMSAPVIDVKYSQKPIKE